MAEKRERNPEAGPLNYVDFKAVNIATECPTLSEILLRRDEEGICPEELDTLKTDLQFMEAVLHQRLQQLETETEILIEWSDKKDFVSFGRKPQFKRKDPDFALPSRPGARLDDRLAKRMKLGSCSDVPTAASSPNPLSSSQTKKQDPTAAKKGPRPKVKGSKSENVESDPQTAARIKLDSSNKFWSDLECYCGPLTLDDVKGLERLMLPQEHDGDLQKIPALGKHYYYRWAQEDLAEEERAGCRIREKKKQSSASTGAPGEKLMKHFDAFSLPLDDAPDQESCSFGPFTQRVLAALIDDSTVDTNSLIATYGAQNPTSNAPMVNGTSAENAANVPPPQTSSRNPNRPWHVPSTKVLEARVRQELVSLGILSPEDIVDDAYEDDEVLAELKKRQSELRAVSEYNRKLKMNLVRLAKIEIEKQNLQEKLKKADSDVVEAYKRMMTAKQKKRPVTKKERDAAWQAIQHRNAVVRELDELRERT